MRKAILLLSILFTTHLVFSQKDFASLVNPFIGTGGHGHTYPGATMPFGMMQLSPDTRMADWDGSSGYHYSDSVIYGFSHTHLSGTGIPDYCDILIMPFTGKVKWNSQDYRSPFSHNNEKAAPGYYEVLLDKHKIKARLTTSYRSGMHQYTYPTTSETGSILIDLKHRDQVLDSYIEQVNEYEVKGYRRSKSWAENQVVYFHIQFQQPIQSFQLADADKEITGNKLQGKDIKAAINFNLPSDKQLQFRIGISGVSMEGAKANLEAEITNWNFEELKDKAKTAWNKELSKIDINGGTKDQQTVFYTALYHTMLAPNIFQDVDGSYLGADKKVHKAEGFTNYTIFSLWDTYRALHPQMSIIDRKRTNDWIQTFLKQYQQGGMLPVWELAANETFCMIGYHSVPVIVDAYQKGIRGFDEKLAMEAMLSYAESNRFGLAHYRHDGYLSNEKEHESVSKTLEYAYDDWCIAQFAKWTGNDSVYKQYLSRAQYYKNVFDASSGHMRGKLEAMWYTPFDPKEINNFFTEGNSWQYSFYVPQDINSLIALHGGKEKFLKKLNELFSTSSVTTGRQQADVTGLIGQYAHGNEPSHHMAYLFNFAGQPWRTQEMVHKINTEFYKNSPDGLIGNEDCGQMSAWFVFSSMGFYPVTPGSGQYIIGTPLFDEVTIHLENGKTFTIQSRKASPKSKYIRSVALNGKLQTHSYIHHHDLAEGGKLSFQLSDAPNKLWGATIKDQPVSVIRDNKIVPVPYFNVKSKKFKKEMLVSINSIEPGVELYYQIIQPNIRSRFVKYTRPFSVYESAEINAYAKRGSEQSKTVVQQFHKLPNDYNITVTSQVHPMYTAGGPEALIDGLTGTENWKTGEWQSYFGKDFEAIIDLKQLKKLNYLGVHVLQDVSPWIVYPKEVIFLASVDGKKYEEVLRVTNKADQQMQTVQTQELGNAVNTQARFIKVKAINGGILPSWHESAGQPSHLFIDEIIIR